jgi:hypothetical protein
MDSAKVLIGWINRKGMTMKRSFFEQNMLRDILECPVFDYGRSTKASGAI